ncbi:acid protease [Violaceomyces palustris]|uniref:Acid protease n=1 Tax=Violaceomyces palustris TaxID=1673888 RepID=A0ACD0NNF0_9BASI|nr:acid protease [Violaceomyces palustris]
MKASAFKPNSQTIRTLDKFQNSYVSGRAKGRIYVDEVRLNGWQGKNLAFGIADDDDAIFSDIDADAIAGLANDAVSTFPVGYRQRTFLRCFEQQDDPDAGTFSVNLNYDTPSSIHFGGIGPSQFGTLEFIPLRKPAGFYVTEAQYVVGTSNPESRTSVVYDTGSAVIIVPLKTAIQLFDRLKVVKHATPDGLLLGLYECESQLEVLQIKLGGKSLFMRKKEMTLGRFRISRGKDAGKVMCVMSILALTDSDIADTWILGGPFFGMAYVTFDSRGSRIGIADKHTFELTRIPHRVDIVDPRKPGGGKRGG